MTRPRTARTTVAALALGLALGAGCSGADDAMPPDDPMGMMPDLSDPTGKPGTDDPVTCTDCAEAKFPDVTAFFERSLHRTCSPNFGVCHNSRQQPDISTLAGFVAAINQRCNGLRDDLSTVDNLCEPPGDSLRITNGSSTYEAAIGQIDLLPANVPLASVTTLVLKFKQPVTERFPPSSTVTLVRSTDGLPPLTLALPANVMMSAIELGKREVTLMAATLRTPLPVGGSRTTWLSFFAPEKYMPGNPQQVITADPNRDGVHGAELDGLMIKPGAPERSYLLLRMIMPMEAPGMLTNQSPKAPLLESQMPLANFDYWDLRNATYGLYCWIKGLTPSGDNALARIDYKSCGPLPAALTPHEQGGEAQTWTAIYSKIIRPQCATVGCHDTGSKAAGLDLSELNRAHAALWNQPSSQNKDPEIRLIYPQNPEQSHLVQKLKGTAPAPFDSRMPLGRELPDRMRAIDSLVTWINQGARNN